MKRTLILFFFVSRLIYSQPITWTELSSTYNLPSGVKLFKGTRSFPSLNCWYLDIDLSKTNLGVKAYLNPVGKEPLTSFSQRYNTIASINGGFFDLTTGTSYSAVVQPDLLLAKNISTVVRDSNKTYYLTRAFFGIKDTREMSMDWIYHYGNRPIDIYKYTNPIPNQQGNPAPAPTPSNGKPYYELITGIGGGPMLVKNSQQRITYYEEVFWGSGVGLTNRDPRTAVGFTSFNHVIMFAADGRQPGISEGLSLTELSQILIELGCVEAMNLDGGGSTTMAVRNTLINNPSDGSQRSIPSMLAVVSGDSIPLIKYPFYNKKIDTEDPNCNLVGSGWLTSSVTGWWGNSPSKYSYGGTGENYAEYSLNLPKAASYDIFAWWTASINRAKNTPFIIKHQLGIDTIRVNQGINGFKWNKIGTFTFNGNSGDKVIISNLGVANDSVIIADGIRILSYDSTVSSTQRFELHRMDFKLGQNYPNPFNGQTIIEYSLPIQSDVRLTIYNCLGEKIDEIINLYQDIGNYQVIINSSDLPSGIYFYRMTAGKYSDIKKLVLLK
jgi:hypothetical protein